MRLSQLAIIVTDDCNFRCSYCPQKKQDSYIKPETIEKALHFFYPTLEENAYIVFYGGEPLLAFEKIRNAVSLFNEKEKQGHKNIQFSLTTNGSLVTDEMLAFFNKNNFQLMLSFDGLAQDNGRQRGSREMCEQLIRRIQSHDYPNIRFSINSVFSPGTVGYLSLSLQSIISTDINYGNFDIQLDLAENFPWNEQDCVLLGEQLEDLTGFLVSYYGETGLIPLESYRKTKEQSAESGSSNNKDTSFACAAGKDRIAVSPREDIWGCHVFHEVFRDRREHPDYETYCFGKLDDFIADYKRLYPRGLYYYDCLSQEYFCAGTTRCFICDDLKNCRVCPAHAAISTSSVGNISPWVCRLNKIQQKEKLRFQREIKDK